MTLKSFLDKRLVSCHASATIQEVSQLMDSENIGSVLILDDDRPVGIITDRDIVVRCVTAGVDCSEARVSEFMSEPVESISDDSDLYAVVRKMRDARVRRLPVVDSKDRAIGLISSDDVLQVLGQELHTLSAPLAPDEDKILR